MRTEICNDCGGYIGDRSCVCALREELHEKARIALGVTEEEYIAAWEKGVICFSEISDNVDIEPGEIATTKVSIEWGEM